MIDKLRPLTLQTSRDERSVDPTEMIDALNITVTGDVDGNSSVIKNIKGTVPVSGATPNLSMPLGENMVIGSTDDETLGVIYFYVYNSLGSHSVWSYSAKSRNYRLIFQDPDGTYLNFQRNGFVKGDLVRVRRIEDDQPVEIWGCTNPAAQNYNPLATLDDGSCFLPTFDPDVEVVNNQLIRLPAVRVDLSILAVSEDFGGIGFFPNVRFDEDGTDYIKNVICTIEVIEGNLFETEQGQNNENIINEIVLTLTPQNTITDGLGFNKWVWGTDEDYIAYINPTQFDNIQLSYKFTVDPQSGVAVSSQNITETVNRVRTLSTIFENNNEIADEEFILPECFNTDSLISRRVVKDRSGSVQGESLLKPFANSNLDADGFRAIVDMNQQISIYENQLNGYIPGTGLETGPIFTPTCFSLSAADAGPFETGVQTKSFSDNVAGSYSFQPEFSYSGPGTMRNKNRFNFSTYPEAVEGNQEPPYQNYGFYNNIPHEFQSGGYISTFSFEDLTSIINDQGCESVVERQTVGAPEFNGPISTDLYDSRWRMIQGVIPPQESPIPGALQVDWHGTTSNQYNILVRELEVDYRNMIFPEYALPSLVSHFCYESCTPCPITDTPDVGGGGTPDFDIEGNDYNIIFNICDYLNPETNEIDIAYSAVQFNADVLENDWGLEEVQAFTQYVGMTAEAIGCPNIISDDTPLEPLPYTGNLCDYPRLLADQQFITASSASSAYIEIIESIEEGSLTSVAATYEVPDLDGDGLITIQDLNLILGMAAIFPIDCLGETPPGLTETTENNLVQTQAIQNIKTTSQTVSSVLKSKSKVSAKKASNKYLKKTSPVSSPIKTKTTTKY